MNTVFDDLAREIARGISRRDALRRMGTGLAGMLLASVGIKKAGAQVTCGTCQACDLDTNTCGQACYPASAGQALCTRASGDGSYLRLANYLTTNGFATSGTSDPVIFYQGGQLLSSTLTTSFTNSGISGETALILYSVLANGDVAVVAPVSQNGIGIYGLSVDSSGNIVQTIFTQQDAFNPSNSIVTKLEPGSAFSKVCSYVGKKLCNFAANRYCPQLSTAFCLGIDLEDLEVTFPECEGFALWLCKTGGGAACNAAASRLCCLPNAYCNGSCCAPCMTCQNNQCTAIDSCLGADPGPCCGNICCPTNYTCSANNVCTPPDSGCNGAFCGSYIDCNAADDCQCYTITEGGGACAFNSYCDEISTCSTSADCGSGSVCAVDTCCGSTPVCLPICTPAANSARPVVSKSKKTGRRTSSHR